MPQFTILNKKRKSPSSPTQVIYLTERNVPMHKKDLIFHDPLKFIEHEIEDTLTAGGFGAVLARAGVGKTAFLIQLALSSLLRNKNVLHISLNDPVKKVSLWYEEVFRNIANEYTFERIDQLFEGILSHRFIMTFKVEGFSVPRFEERLTDLIEQGIFSPQIILIDGLPFDETTKEILSDLKTIAKIHSAHIWFSVRTHHHEKPDHNSIPAPLSRVADLFEVVIQLQPQENDIHVKMIKSTHTTSDFPSLILDPSTMLIHIKKSEK